MATKCRYTREGRSILRNGAPFITITRDGATRPVDADLAARRITGALNHTGDCFAWTSGTLDGRKPKRGAKKRRK